MKFVINKSRWCRGGERTEEIYGEPMLLNGKGFMCCLGQCALQSGFSNDDIFELKEPDDLPLWLNFNNADGENTQFSREAMYINDSDSMSEETRQRKLIQLFEEHGHELEFVENVESE